jgi:hypothetical protein
MGVMNGISYLNCDESSDFRWSETRLYMNLMMGAAIFVLSLVLVCSQADHIAESQRREISEMT